MEADVQGQWVVGLAGVGSGRWARTHLLPWLEGPASFFPLELCSEGKQLGLQINLNKSTEANTIEVQRPKIASSPSLAKCSVPDLSNA